MEKNKRLTIALGIFLCFALILTFLSNTIYNHNLPMVTVKMPGSGKLVHTVEGMSEITYEKSNTVYSNLEGRVSEIYVEKNQAIEKDMPILKIIPDETRINALKLDIAKMENNIELLRRKLNEMHKKALKESHSHVNSIKRIENKIAKLKEEINAIDSAQDGSGEAKNFIERINNAQLEYNNSKILYESGIEPYNNVVIKESQLRQLQNDYESFLENKSLAKNKEIESLQESILALDESKTDESTIILETQFALENAEREYLVMEVELEKRYIDTLYSDYEGVVSSLNIETGMPISQDTAILKIGEVSDEYMINLHIDSKNRDKINLESNVKIKASGMSKEIIGEITSIESIENSDLFNIKISVHSEENLVGYTCKITIENASEMHNVLVSNSVVKKDSDSYYIFVIKEEEGILGNNTFVKRVDITLLDSDNQYSAIDGLRFLEPVVLRSDKVIRSGDRVKFQE